MKNFALIVVDMQNDFVVNNPKIAANLPKILVNIKELIELCKINHHQICYSKDEHTSFDDKEFKRFPPHCMAGSEGANIIDQLLPLYGPVFKKCTYSSLWNTGLHEFLSNKNIDTLIIVGVQTHICILSTVLNALFYGYKVYVVEDCVTSTTHFRKRVALEWMNRYAAKVITQQEAKKICD